MQSARCRNPGTRAALPASKTPGRHPECLCLCELHATLLKPPPCTGVPQRVQWMHAMPHCELLRRPPALATQASKHARTRPPRRRTIANRVAPRSSGGASGCWSEPSSAGSLVLVMGSPSLGGRRAASSSLLPSARARFLEGPPPSAMPTPPLLARLCAPRRREPLLIRARERRRRRCAAARGERACLLLAVGFCEIQNNIYIQ